MNIWAEDAMRNAIDYLARARRNDLAADLARIARAIVFDELEIMRSEEIAGILDDVSEAQSIADLTECLRRLAKALCASHCTLHVVSEYIPETHSTKVITTYYKEWIDLYIKRRYYTIDPIMQASRTQKAGFFWDALQNLSPLCTAFWKDAVEHGVGASGYTLPIVTEHGDVLALSVSSTGDPASFRDSMLRHESDFLNFSIILAESFSDLASNPRPGVFDPTDDQILVLRAVAVGCDEAELESRTYTYGSYATVRRSICKLFGTRTVAQAAVMAARIGLLDNAPLCMADILSASAANGAFDANTDRTLRRLLANRSAPAGRQPEGDGEHPAA